MDYLIRFVQMHESFRKPETDALAELAGIELQLNNFKKRRRCKDVRKNIAAAANWVVESKDGEKTPFAIVRFPISDDGGKAAKRLAARSTLSSAIFELWGAGTDYTSLHSDVRKRTAVLWEQHRYASFRFDLDAYQGSRTSAETRAIIETFSYTSFEGPILMTNADEHFTIFEEYDARTPEPKKVYLGRLVAESGRKAIAKYSLKKRKYIATTSMDAELSLVTANLALCAPGKLVYDPFMGTGSFMYACAYFGAVVTGSDLDGRSIRGKANDRSVSGNFKQYGTLSSYLGGFVADLTNTPLRESPLFDAILCDPPYGVREGLKVLGSSKSYLQQEVRLADGSLAHLSSSYVPPKRAYSFTRMLDDILNFAAQMLVENGKLCMWMPVAGETQDETSHDGEYEVPGHPQLELRSECVQHFNKWSRRLLTYQRLPENKVDHDQLQSYQAARHVLAEGDSRGVRGTADDLNAFRKKYFQGFKEPPPAQG